MLDQFIGLLLDHGDLRGFLELGGPVLWLVIGAGFLMWLLIIERAIYLAFGLARDSQRLRAIWQARAEHRSWQARQIRRELLAELELRSASGKHLIGTLIALAPLLGLLGTVTGMLEVFDVMAQTGTANARAMAGGISRATLPTLAGMVMALAGLYFNALLGSWERRSLRRIRFRVLRLEGGQGAPT
ncbi:MotA/TolQ/ExbB proton channel family protein [Magnetovirga frankeli]|uniref:MotA/TolQ/ExbB proton channel family protein n=1 Tax=Magnetovirga frankeli TaxID=947516 RepID=UPI001293DD87|nr:MotA/TolQ/ExbB proton channel family protein [gamma proteobacterium SS-5]